MAPTDEPYSILQGGFGFREEYRFRDIQYPQRLDDRGHGGFADADRFDFIGFDEGDLGR